VTRSHPHPMYGSMPALIFLMSLVFFAIGSISLQYIQNHLVAMTGESLALAASTIADMVDRVLFERYSDVPMMARARVFQGRDTAAMTDYLNWVLRNYQVYRWLGVLDASGRIIAATSPASVGKDLSRAPMFRNVRDRGGVHMQDVEVSEEAGGIPVVSFAGPIIGPAGEFRGTVLTHVGLAVLESISTAAVNTFQIQRGSAGKFEYQIMTRDGDLIVDSILRQEMQVNLKQLGLPSALLSASALPGYIEETHVRRKVPVVTGYAQAEGSGFEEFVSLHWGVLVRMDRSDILTPIWAIQWKLGLTGAVLVLPLIGLLLWSSRRLQREWAAGQEESARAVAAESIARESEERYRLVAETATDAILTIDGETRILFGNRAAEQIFGYSRHEMQGQPLTVLLPERLRSVRKAAFEKDLETGEKYIAWQAVELTGLHKTGKEIPVDVSFGEFTKDGQHYSTIILRDITERKQAQEALRQTEAQLRQSQKMEAIGKLAGGIAHDFNNLLTGVRGYSELLLNHFQPGDPLRNNVEAIRQAAAQAASLTHQLLVISRRQVLAPRVLNLNAVVTNLGPILRRLIGEDIELSILLHRGLGRVRADHSQIEQIILNLVVNARDAMPKGGKLTIEMGNVELDKPYAIQHDLVPPGRYVRLVVTDTGCGMDAETQAHIFEPFFTTKEPWRGTGLGLSTVYGIVKQSRGHICFHSEPDRGTTFTIYLPRTLDVPRTVQPESALATPLGGVETVLVVEDNETVVGVVREILERNGYTVLVARTSGEAFRINGQHEGIIHLMITDVVMPGMNGRDLAERLRSARPNMKVLYMSGYIKDAFIGHGALVEDVAFLPKPFTPDALLKKARAVLGSPAMAIRHENPRGR